MAWRIDLTQSARDSLAKLDPSVAKRIVSFLRTRIAPAADPRALGKALRGPLRDYWRYRVGDYRLICDIQDQVLRVLVVAVGNRKDVYD